jgi:hypothetical protein
VSFFSKYYLSVFVAGLLVSCSSVTYHSLWQYPPLKADGIPDEWASPLKLYDSGSDYYYSVSNDLDRLYIRIKTKNKQTQAGILRNGIQFWIDTAGKNRELIGLQFPIAVKPRKNSGSSDIADYDEPAQNQQRQQRSITDVASLMDKFNRNEKLMHLSGFKPPAGGVVPIPNDFGIEMGIGLDSTNTMTYEASVPFATFFRSGLLNSDSTKIFGVSIEITGISGQEGSGMGSPAGFGPGMGGLGMGMGMGMGGMGFGMSVPLGGRGGFGNPGNSYGSTKKKMKIKLAVKP